MKQAELTWWRLSFPRDLSQYAVQAALASFSGLPHPTRLLLDLSATHEGITHAIGVSPMAADSVRAALRAAVPSLSLEAVEPLADLPPRHQLWQLNRRAAAIRMDELAAIAANLLANLFPLERGECLRLRWVLRPGLRPHLETSDHDRRSGRTQILRNKLALPGMSAYGQLAIEAISPTRARELRRRLSTTLWSLSAPAGQLVGETPLWGRLLYLLGRRGRYLSVAELAAVIGWPIEGPDLPALELGSAKRLVPSAALPRTGRILGTSNFEGLSRPIALSENASTRGLYVLGPTGTGKTALLKNLIQQDMQQGRGLAVVETNGDLIRDLLDLVPPERIQDVVLLDPTDSSHAVGFNPFVGSSDASLVADQLSELFQRLWQAYWGPRTAQLAHMGLLTLARRQGSTLLDLPRLYLDEAFRMRVLADLDDPVGLEPDWQWFARLPEREQATVVAPLLNKVRQFTARSSIRAIVGQPSPATSMPAILAEQKLLLVHLPKGLIGAETATLLGCLILTALWQATAQRAALPMHQRTPFGLYVDEVQDFADAPIPWEEMFAQGRKYGLRLSVAHQNLGQLPKDLRDVILANARSQVVFALSAADAKVLERSFGPSLTAADLQALDAYSVAARIGLDNGSTARPVTLQTLPPPEPLGVAEQVGAASRQHYGRLKTEIEQALRQAARPSSVVPVGRKPRRPS